MIVLGSLIYAMWLSVCLYGLGIKVNNPIFWIIAIPIQCMSIIVFKELFII